MRGGMALSGSSGQRAKPNHLQITMPAVQEDASSDGDDSGNGSDFNEPATTTSRQEVSRPRPQAQVSFRLPRPGNMQDDHERFARSEPSTLDRRDFGSVGSLAMSTASDQTPRDRRRLFRDMSYTARAVRRDTLQRGHGSRGGRGSLFSNAHGRGGGGLDPISGSNHSNNSRDNVNGGGRGGGRPRPPRRQGSFRRKARRQSSIRAVRGGRGRNDGRTRIKEYCDEKTQRLKSYVNRNNDNGTSAAETEADLSSSQTSMDQYHIPPPEESNFSIMDAFFQLYSLAFGDLAMWVYGASFGKVLLFFLALYMMFVYCFVVILYLVDKHYTGSFCINDVSEELGEVMSTRSHFEFAFELSWTTFTTVGYGNVGPPSDVGCYPIRFLCSVEAISGMAFVSMCSGLFYAKLLKLLGRAPVTFSSTICVQYGKGLQMGKMGEFHQSQNKNVDAAANDSCPEEEEKEEGPSSPQSAIGGESFNPYPVIEFRIVNNRANHAAGKNEIWDAEVTAIVQLSIENDENIEAVDSFRINNTSSRWDVPSPPKANNDTTDKQSQKVYYKLALKPSFHPYFSRVWILRHTLDATSPLLRREVRNMIRDQSGWDHRWNSYRDVRKCLVEFNTLQIIMNGASALSRSEVYAEKTYGYGDVCVGWRYVAVCYEEESSDAASWRCKRLHKKLHRKNQRNHFSYGDDTTTRVDLSLIHDIVPQLGGDFEPTDEMG